MQHWWAEDTKTLKNLTNPNFWIIVYEKNMPHKVKWIWHPVVSRLWSLSSVPPNQKWIHNQKLWKVASLHIPVIFKQRWVTAKRLKQNSGENKMLPIKSLKYVANADKLPQRTALWPETFFMSNLPWVGNEFASVTTVYVALLGRLVWSSWKAH